jgi:uncharacterized protein
MGIQMMLNKFQRLFYSVIFTCLTVTVNAQDFKEPQIQVTGEAVLMKPADQLSLSVGVVTLAKDAEQAIQENAQNMSQVIDSLGQIGLTKDNYKTGRYAITPIYSTPPKNPPASWSPEIIAYRVSNHLNIQTDQIDMAGSMIDQVNQAGANSIDQLTFELKDPTLYRSEAITLATKNAMKDAEVLAQASNVNLAKILSVSLQSTPQYPVYKNALMMSASRGYNQTPIESGDVEVRASVNITYAITN